MPKNKRLHVENKVLHELNMKAITEYYRYRTEQASIDEKQKEEFERIDKILLKRKDLRSGFTFIASGPVWLDPKTGKRLFPHQLICALGGIDPTNDSSWEYILEIQKILPNFRVSWWNHQKGLCRVILDDGMSDEIRKKFVPTHEQKRIFAESLTKCSERKAFEADKIICEKLLKTKSSYPQLDIMREYLHTLPFSTFLKFRRENGFKVLGMAKTYDETQGNHNQQQLVQAMWDEVRPHYPPSSTDNPLLARICAPNFSNVKSELRRAWFSGCIEFDFQNLHYACLVSLYPEIMKETSSWLTEGLSIWQLIMNSMKISEEDKLIAKPIIKPRTYAIEYGMDPEYAQKKLHEELKNANIHFSSKLLDCVQVKELAQATQQCLSDIKTKEGMIGPFGWKEWNKEISEESFMANIMQSYEIALRFPLYELAIAQRKNNNTLFDIIHDQHDGIAVLSRNKKEEEAKKQIISCASKAINLYKIKTSLICK